MARKPKSRGRGTQHRSQPDTDTPDIGSKTSDGKSVSHSDQHHNVTEPASAAEVPTSVTYMWVNFLAFAVTVGVWYAFHDNYEIARRHLALLCICVYGVLVIGLENIIYKVYRRPSTGHDYTRKFSPDIGRIILKTIGFYATIACVAFFFFIFEIYRREFFTEVWLLAEDVKPFWPIIVVIQLVYFSFSDGYQTKTEDSYWMLGKICVGDYKVIDGQILGQHFLGWLVKAFFLPIMYKYLVGNFYGLHFGWVGQGFIQFYDFAFITMFTVDLLITCAGYLLTFKVLDSHIRSTEPTMLGWCVALAGYYPFWDALSSAYFPYNDGMYWGHMTGDSMVWGWIIIVLVLIYIWATLAFGIRFSNLTHRGVLTNGPYRFCKHPAYVSKNMSWWMISVPFWMHPDAQIDDTIRHSIMLFGVNIIYFMRARTEERHLSWDPDYVAYALWMNNHSVFAWFGRIIPALQYKPPPQPIIRKNSVSQYLAV